MQRYYCKVKRCDSERCNLRHLQHVDIGSIVVFYLVMPLYGCVDGPRSAMLPREQRHDAMSQTCETDPLPRSGTVMILAFLNGPFKAAAYALWSCSVFQSFFGSLLWFVKVTFLGDPAGFHGAGWPRLQVEIRWRSQVYFPNSDVFILQCAVKVFNVMESQDLRITITVIPFFSWEAKLRYKWLLLTKKTFSPHGGFMRDEMFLISIFFPTSFLLCFFCFSFLLSLLQLALVLARASNFYAKTVWRINTALEWCSWTACDDHWHQQDAFRIVKVEQESDSSQRFLWQGIRAIIDMVLKNNRSNDFGYERFQLKVRFECLVGCAVLPNGRLGSTAGRLRHQKGFGVPCFANLKAVNVPIWMCSLQLLRYEDDPALRESPVRIAKAFLIVKLLWVSHVPLFLNKNHRAAKAQKEVAEQHAWRRTFHTCNASFVMWHHVSHITSFDATSLASTLKFHVSILRTISCP